MPTLKALPDKCIYLIHQNNVQKVHNLQNLKKSPSAIQRGQRCIEFFKREFQDQVFNFNFLKYNTKRETTADSHFESRLPMLLQLHQALMALKRVDQDQPIFM